MKGSPPLIKSAGKKGSVIAGEGCKHKKKKLVKIKKLVVRGKLRGLLLKYSESHVVQCTGQSNLEAGVSWFEPCICH